MSTYDYPGQPPVTTDDPDRIANLLRKGWTQRPEQPAYNPTTQCVRWDGSQWIIEALPLSEIQARIGSAIQQWIDVVCTSGVPYFRDIFSARGYVGDPNPAYHARAVLLRDWSSSVWTTLDAIQADVLAGKRPMPSEADLLSELPQPPE